MSKYQFFTRPDFTQKANHPGSAYMVRKDVYAHDTPSAPLLLDTRRMAVSCIISTQAKDRSGDIVRTLGIDTTNHIKNPVVLWDHGISGLVIPIGKAEDPDGRYTVRLENDRATATTYFAQSLPEAQQFFRMIEEKVLRGASIGFKANDIQPLPPDRRSDRQGVCIAACELIEYSHTPIPDNQDALCRVLDLKRIGSERLSEVVYKSLSLLVPARAPLVSSGFSAANLADRIKTVRERLHPKAQKSQDAPGH